MIQGQTNGMMVIDRNDNKQWPLGEHQLTTNEDRKRFMTEMLNGSKMCWWRWLWCSYSRGFQKTVFGLEFYEWRSFPLSTPRAGKGRDVWMTVQIHWAFWIYSSRRIPTKWIKMAKSHSETLRSKTHTHISYIHIYPHLASGLKACWISHAYVENGSQQAPVGASPCTSWFGFPGDAGMNRHQLWYMWAMDVWIHQNRLEIFKGSPGTNQPIAMRSGELAIAFPNIIHGM